MAENVSAKRTLSELSASGDKLPSNFHYLADNEFMPPWMTTTVNSNENDDSWEDAENLDLEVKSSTFPKMGRGLFTKKSVALGIFQNFKLL